jgi:hypothetical protein
MGADGIGAFGARSDTGPRTETADPVIVILSEEAGGE